MQVFSLAFVRCAERGRDMGSLLIKRIVQSNLCCGCGACYAICPHDAIDMKIALDGAYRPFIDLSKCSFCRLCERVCPGVPFAQKIMVNGLGSLIRCYVGYSTDSTIRWKASSGGLVTTILLSLLEESVISGAVVVKDNPDDPLRPFMTLVKDEEEIKGAMGSRYCPVEPRFKVKDLIREQGKIAVVGLPCHIQAFRRLEEVVRELRNKVLIHLGLFCGKSPNFYAITYFLRKVAEVYESDIAHISYRGRGWSGKGIIITKHGNSFAFGLSNWCNFSYYPHFIPIRCAMCYDITNQHADISLGDAWGLSHDKVGTSVIITRTHIGESIIQHLHNTGRLVLHEVKPEQISRGQGLENKVKNSLVRTYMWHKIFHQLIPFAIFNPPKTSIRNWIFNLGYCTLLYITQNRFMRIAFCNITPQISKILRLAKWKI